MSYDINLLEPVSLETIILDDAHDMRGGTYALGGTKEAWLNITYNYSKHYYEHIDSEEGIRFIFGMTGSESIPVLEKAISKLGNDTDTDYWKATEGNAKVALLKLVALAKLRPDGIWDGD
jgi:hypothetical protein